MFGVTTIHPVALSFTLLMALVTLFIPRKFAVLPFLMVAVFVTEAQRIVVGGFDFTMLRILLLAGFIRIFLRGENLEYEWNAVDLIVVVFTILDVTAYCLLRKTGDAFANRIGFVYSTLGIYFFVRCTVRSRDDIVLVATLLAFMCSTLAASMLIEQLTGRNMFSVFGGVPAITEMRAGQLRSQGAFPHALLAGAFGATLCPVFIGLWALGRKAIGGMGILASIMIAATSMSSSPVLALAAGLLGVCFWLLRTYLREVRWMIVAMVIALAIVMKAPVWALIGRLSVFGASSGYHRFNVVDQAIKRFSEWALLGTRSTAHWGWGLWDITNEYVSVGVEGGVGTLIVFMALIVRGFRNVGVGIRTAGSRTERFFVWCFGAALFSHCVAFIGMAYFGAQILVNWLFALAVLGILPDLVSTAERTQGQPVNIGKALA
jgi:hypothetical protein